MVIRQTQMAALTQSRQKDFEHSMAGHLQRCFPNEYKALGEKGTRSEIRYGIGQAATHGISLERNVCKYIDLMFVFGRDFDRDPGLPWAPRILADGALNNETLRTERLFEEAKLQMVKETLLQ